MRIGPITEYNAQRALYGAAVQQAARWTRFDKFMCIVQASDGMLCMYSVEYTVHEARKCVAQMQINCYAF